MALPNDVTTCTLSFGPYRDSLGNPMYVGMTGEVKPSEPLLHVGDGSVIVDSPIPIMIDGTGSATVTLPHTDLDTLFPSGVTYTCTWLRSRHPSTPGNKTFILPEASGNAADYDLLALIPMPGGGTVFVPVATSVNGKSGAVTLTAADVGADPAGAATTAQGASLQKSANLSDLASASTARTNLGLGSAATQAATAFDTAGVAAIAQAAEQTRAEATYAKTADVGTPGTPTGDALRAALVLPKVGGYTYNTDGTVATGPDGETYAYNGDGTVHSVTLGGVTRVYSYNTDGTVAGAA